MTDDLVNRLRDWETVYPEDEDKDDGCLYLEAADRIEDLEAKLSESEALLAEAVDALLETNEAFAKTVGLRRHKAWATINKTNRLLAELTSSEAAYGEAKGDNDE